MSIFSQRLSSFFTLSVACLVTPYRTFVHSAWIVALRCMTRQKSCGSDSIEKHHHISTILVLSKALCPWYRPSPEWMDPASSLPRTTQSVMFLLAAVVTVGVVQCVQYAPSRIVPMKWMVPYVNVNSGKRHRFLFSLDEGKERKQELCSPARERGWYGTDDNHRCMSPTLLERPSSYSRTFY